MSDEEVAVESLAGRTIVRAEFQDEGRRLVAWLDDDRAVTIKASAYDDAWLIVTL